VLGTVGEPIDPAAWKWYYEVVGNAKASIVDTYWQTETGGHMISPLPGATPIKPGYATFPLPDVKKDGKPVYFTGDGAMMDEDGYIKITGRTDDVINVSGHRIGTAEIEDAIKKVDSVAVSAVVGKPHDIKGEGIFAYIVLKEAGSADAETIKAEINAVLKQEIGAIALCDQIAIVPDVPKTRSGKIMRRILRAIAKGEPISPKASRSHRIPLHSRIQVSFLRLRISSTHPKALLCQKLFCLEQVCKDLFLGRGVA